MLKYMYMSTLAPSLRAIWVTSRRVMSDLLMYIYFNSLLQARFYFDIGGILAESLS